MQRVFKRTIAPGSRVHIHSETPYGYYEKVGWAGYVHRVRLKRGRFVYGYTISQLHARETAWEFGLGEVYPTILTFQGYKCLLCKEIVR